MIWKCCRPWLAVLTAAIPAIAIGAKPIDLGFELASNLPPAFARYLLSHQRLDEYELAAWINPFYLQADFNGDDQLDTAIWLWESASRKGGLLIHHGGTEEHYVIAAGNEFRDRGDDFSRFNGWYVFPQGSVPESSHADGAPPELLGDALHLEVLEAGSGIVYWTGTEYSWYQQGD